MGMFGKERTRIDGLAARKRRLNQMRFEKPTADALTRVSDVASSILSYVRGLSEEKDLPEFGQCLGAIVSTVEGSSFSIKRAHGANGNGDDVELFMAGMNEDGKGIGIDEAGNLYQVQHYVDSGKMPTFVFAVDRAGDEPFVYTDDIGGLVDVIGDPEALFAFRDVLDGVYGAIEAEIDQLESVISEEETAPPGQDGNGQDGAPGGASEQEEGPQEAVPDPTELTDNTDEPSGHEGDAGTIIDMPAQQEPDGTVETGALDEVEGDVGEGASPVEGNGTPVQSDDGEGISDGDADGNDAVAETGSEDASAPVEEEQESTPQSEQASKPDESVEIEDAAGQEDEDAQKAGEGEDPKPAPEQEDVALPEDPADQKAVDEEARDGQVKPEEEDPTEPADDNHGAGKAVSAMPDDRVAKLSGAYYGNRMPKELADFIASKGTDRVSCDAMIQGLVRGMGPIPMVQMAFSVLSDEEKPAGSAPLTDGPRKDGFVDATYPRVNSKEEMDKFYSKAAGRNRTPPPNMTRSVWSIERRSAGVTAVIPGTATTQQGMGPLEIWVEWPEPSSPYVSYIIPNSSKDVQIDRVRATEAEIRAGSPGIKSLRVTFKKPDYIITLTSLDGADKAECSAEALIEYYAKELARKGPVE